MNEHIEARLQDYAEWKRQIEELEEQIKLKQIAKELVENKLNETMKTILDLKKGEMENMAHYYFYKLTSNRTFKVVKKVVSDIPSKLDIDNIQTNNYFFRKTDAEKEAEKFIKVLEKSFAK